MDFLCVIVSAARMGCARWLVLAGMACTLWFRKEASGYQDYAAHAQTVVRAVGVRVVMTTTCLPCPVPWCF